MIESYAKIFNIGSADAAQLLTGTVVTQEKVDGSQISFHREASGVELRSKSQPITPDNGMFKLALESLSERELSPGLTYRGEFLQKPKHNKMVYARVPKDHIILFDAQEADGSFLSPQELDTEGARLGLEVVPRFVPADFNLSTLDSLLETESVLGGCTIEGLVFKNYNKTNRFGQVLMGKYVSPKMREKQAKIKGPFVEITDSIGEALRVEARWDKAIQHLRERNELQGGPEDIGPLLKEIKEDILAEESDFIVDELLKWATPKVLKSATYGFPEWYKRHLVETSQPSLAAQSHS